MSWTAERVTRGVDSHQTVRMIPVRTRILSNGRCDLIWDFQSSVFYCLVRLGAWRKITGIECSALDSSCLLGVAKSDG